VSAQLLTKKPANLIEKETLALWSRYKSEFRTMNVEGMYSVYFYKKTERSLRLVGVVAPTPRRAIQQIFNLQYSIPACPGWVSVIRR
jgi:hypothetical protein